MERQDMPSDSSSQAQHLQAREQDEREHTAPQNAAGEQEYGDISEEED